VHGRVRCCSATPHLQGLQRHELPRTEAQMLVDRQRWDVDLDPSLCANAREKRDSRIAFALLNGSKAAAGIACNCSESSSHTRELRRRVRVSLRRTATRAIDERQVACILIDCLRARRARATARRVRKRRATA
jgi:hypothetical protein